MGVYTRNGIVTNGLIAHYDAANSLSYTSGSGTWKDLTGNNNNVTIPSAIAYGSKNGGTLVFNGTSATAITGVSIAGLNLNTVNALTVDCWIYYNTVNSYQFWFATTDANYRFGILVSNGSFYWNMSSRNDRNPGVSITPLKWYHVVMTGGLVGGSIYTNIYSNGNLVYTQNEAISSLIAETSINIGCGEGSGVYQFSGNMASMKIYNSTLSYAQVSQNYNATKGRFGL